MVKNLTKKERRQTHSAEKRRQPREKGKKNQSMLRKLRMFRVRIHRARKLKLRNVKRSKIIAKHSKPAL